MSYQVLARKWRPQAFDALIGQREVVTALTNALREGRIAQAYLFSGIRGVGKTTAARLFAKALNCEKGPAAGPCNECATCRDITRGSDLDVLEIDAATYSKVEQVRELAESLKYGPTRDRYKVVVVDEVHRLSRQAFDALLKIVEEPPPRLVFVFATTEVDAVPATILSRCQEFHFRRVGAAEVAAHLGEIAAAEGIAASARALRLLARAGEGSVRDSVALLDQLATFGNGTIDEAEASRLVGGLDLALFAALLAAILSGDARRVSALARESEAQGWDPRQVHAHFLAYCRDALHLALGGAPAELDLPADDGEALAALVAEAQYENLLRLLHHLLASEAGVRRSDAAALALELAWLRAAELPKLVAIEALLAGDDGAARPAPPAAPAKLRAAAAPRPAPPAAAVPLAPSAQPPSIARAAGATTDALLRFREELSARRPTLAASLGAARLRHADGVLTIELPGDDPLGAKQLERASNRELLGAAAAATFGAGTRLRLVEAPPAAPGDAVAAPAAASGDETPSPAADDPRVQAVLDIFGGTVATVEPADDEESA
ncbi:MAG TPA: DNA polymerase III subunit gamma/tau [Thermoanaerobaculia bacterium]|jgi:DNA polymerase-3 subunit gamma/tau